MRAPETLPLSFVRARRTQGEPIRRTCLIAAGSSSRSRLAASMAISASSCTCPSESNIGRAGRGRGGFVTPTLIAGASKHTAPFQAASARSAPRALSRPPSELPPAFGMAPNPSLWPGTQQAKPAPRCGLATHTMLSKAPTVNSLIRIEYFRAALVNAGKIAFHLGWAGSTPTCVGGHGVNAL
jgi:hypothetical protein